MPDPEKQKLIQQQLVLLLHAKKCQKREKKDPSVKCALAHCGTMKNVLNHMAVCNMKEKCSVAHCVSSRQILSHWDFCNRTDCPICSLLRSAKIATQGNAQKNDTADQFTMSAQFNQQSTDNTVPNPKQSDAEKRKLIHQQLVVLLHADECRNRENGDPSAKCTLVHCVTMKNVLNHMADCNMGKDCLVSLCYSSRQILSHWKNCNRVDCTVCSPLRSANNEINHNVATTNPPTMENESNDPTQQLVSEITDVLQSMSLHPSPQISQDQLSNANDLDLSTLLVDTPVNIYNDEPLNMDETNDWRNSVTQEIRNHLAHKIVLSIFPAPDPTIMLDKRMTTLIEYAKKVEGDMYEKAHSRSDYYHLVAEKIYKVQKELEEKRQKRREQQMAAQYAATTSAPSTSQCQAANVGTFYGANDPSSSTSHPTNISHDWHNSITIDLRNHLIHKLVQEMSPALPAGAMHDKRWNDWVADAKKIEEEMYERASSRSQYYHLLASGIYKIQQDFVLKRENRRDPQMALNYGATTSAAAIALEKSERTVYDQFNQLKPNPDASNLNQPNQPIQQDDPAEVQNEIDDDWMIIDSAE